MLAAGQVPGAVQEPKEGEKKPAAGQDQSGQTRPASPGELDRELLLKLDSMRKKKQADWTAEELAEAVALVYGGKRHLRQVYGIGREEGRIELAMTTGTIAGDYVRRYAMGETASGDRVRLDLVLESTAKPGSNVKYTIAYNGAAVWSAQNNEYVMPDGAAASAFKATVINDYTLLFRWQEEAAKLARLPAKRLQGIDVEVLELTRPDGTRTRFLISGKSFRILHVEYDVVLAADKPPVAYRESYSEWRTIQQTLVPGRRKLRQNDTLVQTMELGSAQYGVKHDDTVFLQY